MIDIQINVVADEVLLRLDGMPKRVREAVTAKYQKLFSQLKMEFESVPPGKFVGPERIKSGTEQVGSLIVGYIEVEPKGGTYLISPDKAKVLRFLSKGGEVVFSKFVEHPYMNNTTEAFQRMVAERKPWLIDQIEDAAIEAL